MLTSLKSQGDKGDPQISSLHFFGFGDITQCPIGPSLRSRRRVFSYKRWGVVRPGQLCCGEVQWIGLMEILREIMVFTIKSRELLSIYY